MTSNNVTLPGIPESIIRDEYLKLVESVGFDAKDLESLEFRWDGIYANVYATDEQGRRMVESGGWAGNGLTSREPAMHRVFVRVEDSA